jgi:signal transduction histidine kinase
VIALRQQATTFERGGLVIRLDAPERLPPLPAAVEVAAYRIAQEALTNVIRHAHAQTCVLRLEIDLSAATLKLEVLDDGRGLPSDSRAGVGLTSMRERAAELGGCCTIGRDDGGGTRVVAHLPLPGNTA